MEVLIIVISTVTAVIIAVIAGVLCLVVGIAIGIAYRKKIAEAAIGSAEEKAKTIVNEAIKLGETKQKEALLEAKEEIHKNRAEADKEIKERRSELQKMEKRLTQKEETLDKRADSYEKKESVLTAKIKDVEARQLEIEEIKAGQRAVLERISGMTADQAKVYLMETLENDLKHEKALMVSEYMNMAKEEAENNAKDIISLAIQRCASDHVSETTVSVVSLPNDEMKGRIIGREGRNIRALEQLTGVDLIIDDTPETITLSSFDMVRREIARIALEKLIQDGRIHPTRVSEMVEKARKEVETTIKKEGERAIFETGVHGIHPELMKLLGRLRYRTSFGQNVLNHSIEVSHLAGLLAGELGADVTAAKRAGLLHDIGKALDQQTEGSHVSIGVEVARKYKEHENIVHAIEAHHGDVEAKSILAAIVQAADAISAARPGARREDIENYIKRLERLEELTKDFKGVERTYAIQAGREIRVIVKPEEVSDDSMILLARDIANRIENELEYPGQIKVHVIRENRAIEYAK
ncbi:MAG: ribonuclease Y [Ruminococcaceae bacterium]|nr:ribonuclease Y [Oscillospiraceae bacterium]